MEALARRLRAARGSGLGPAGEVYFSDVLGGGVYRWSPDGEVETVLEKRRGIGGMCLHADGGAGRLRARRDPRARRRAAGPARGLDGVTGFNDLGVDADGRVYVGALRFRPFGGESPVPGEIWRIGDGRRAVAARRRGRLAERHRVLARRRHHVRVRLRARGRAGLGRGDGARPAASSPRRRPAPRTGWRWTRRAECGSRRGRAAASRASSPTAPSIGVWTSRRLRHEPLLRRRGHA